MHIYLSLYMKEDFKFHSTNEVFSQWILLLPLQLKFQFNPLQHKYILPCFGYTVM